MAEVALPVARNQDVHLDICTKCQFVWFDSNELEQLPKRPPTTVQPTKELPQKVREAVAIAEAQRVAVRARGAEYGSEMPEEAWKWIPAMVGLPVEHDVQALRTLPWLTWALTVTLIAVTALTYGDLFFVVQQYGLIPAEAWRHGGLTFITAFFLHAGILHLVGNVYFLLVFGDNVEDYLGRLRFLALILIATIVGDVMHILFEPRSELPCVGASGGISGIIVYYALQFPNARLGIVVRYWYVFKWFYFPAYFALICWILMQFLTAHLQVSGLTNVSAIAHLGGAATGLGAWLLWRNK
jgi:membrane associated rhomboid family serine protease